MQFMTTTLFNKRHNIGYCKAFSKWNNKKKMIGTKILLKEFRCMKSHFFSSFSLSKIHFQIFTIIYNIFNYFIHLQLRCCYISALVLTCFRLTKKRRVVLRFFDPKQLLRVSCVLRCCYPKCYSIIFNEFFLLKNLIKYINCYSKRMIFI